jgi:2-oxoglutarate ferredoxin oxidoreductase subunit alpha
MGPSTGEPTSPAQGDIMQPRWGTHGDHPIVALCPSTIQEVLELTIVSFDFAERYRTPVVLMMDETIGHMRERVGFPRMEDVSIFRRMTSVEDPEGYLPYRMDTPDSVPPLLSFGDGARYHVTGLIHDQAGFPTRLKNEITEWYDRIFQKFDKAREQISLYEGYNLEDADTVIISCGISARTSLEAMQRARRAGVKAGVLKLITLWPFPEDVVRQLTETAERIIVPELNRGQLVLEVERLNKRGIPVTGVHRYDGGILSPGKVLEAMGL